MDRSGTGGWHCGLALLTGTVCGIFLFVSVKLEEVIWHSFMYIWHGFMLFKLFVAYIWYGTAGWHCCLALY